MQKKKKQLIVFLTYALLGGMFYPATVTAYEAAPVAVSKAATFITEKSARLNAQGNSNEVPDALGWFEWGISGRAGNIYETPHQPVRSSRNTLIDINAGIIGLAPDTQYFFRYIIESSRGKNVGQTVYFTTKQRAALTAPIVIVETNTPGSITSVSAELLGYVSPHGDTKTSAWFEWGTTQQLESQTPPRNVSGSAGPVSVVINNLTSGTLYFYRVVGENASGRTYGATRVFTTTGTPPPPPLPPEQPINQNIPTPNSGDGVARTTTTSGIAGAGANGRTNVFAMGSSNIPTLGSFFRKKATTNTGEGTSTSNNGGVTQTASVANATSPLGVFWNNLTGKSLIEVTIEKVGPKTVTAHTPVEYLVSYTYGESATAKNARLSITFPSDVIYIGDNTANELLIQETDNGERTYILPLGDIQKGGARSFSILGITTGSATGFPDARAWFEYENATGAHIVEANAGKNTSAKSNTAAAASTDGGGILPDTVWGWLLYVLLIVGAIFGFRKGKEYFIKRKEEIAARENEQPTPLSRIAQGDSVPQSA